MTWRLLSPMEAAALRGIWDMVARSLWCAQPAMWWSSVVRTTSCSVMGRQTERHGRKLSPTCSSDNGQTLS